MTFRPLIDLNSCFQNRVSVNICTSIPLGRCDEPWRKSRAAGKEKVKQHLLSLAPSSPLGSIFCKSGKGGLTLHACHQASAFKSRFNAREKEIHFYPLYWESIQRVMANLLDCHGNRWEKWFLSVSLCVSRCWRGCIVRLYRSSTGQNAALQCSLSSLL